MAMPIRARLQAFFRADAARYVDQYGKCYWSDHIPDYLAYRAVVTVYMFISLCLRYASLGHYRSLPSAFLLTNWNYTLTVWSYMLGLVSTLQIYTLKNSTHAAPSNDTDQIEAPAHTGKAVLKGASILSSAPSHSAPPKTINERQQRPGPPKGEEGCCSNNSNGPVSASGVELDVAQTPEDNPESPPTPADDRTNANARSLVYLQAMDEPFNPPDQPVTLNTTKTEEYLDCREDTMEQRQGEVCDLGEGPDKKQTSAEESNSIKNGKREKADGKEPTTSALGEPANSAEGVDNMSDQSSAIQGSSRLGTSEHGSSKAPTTKRTKQFRFEQCEQLEARATRHSYHRRSVMVQGIIKNRDGSITDHLQWYADLGTKLYNTTLPLNLILSVLYFCTTAEYNSYSEIQTFILNAVLMLIDFSLTSVPIVMYQCVYPLGLALIWLGFGSFYRFYARKATAIEQVLTYPESVNWGMVWRVEYLLLLLFCFPATHLCLFLLHKFKQYLHTRIIN